MAVIPSLYLNAVVSLGIKCDKETKWIGTGFFIHRLIDKDGLARPYLVTNRHVVLGVDILVMRMKEKTSDNLKFVDVNLKVNGEPNFALHDDHTIDIAVIPLNGGAIEQGNLEFPSFDIDSNAMDSIELRENGIDEGSLLYMLGFPMGLVNEKSGLPICRLGCVARISEAQINEMHNILVDVQNFPGNSGSPIVSRPEFMATTGTKSLSKCVLMGIIHSYIPYEEKLINNQTQRVVEIRSENSGIALMHPVEYIREIVDKIQPKI